MTYIDKRALHTGKSPLSLTPYVNLNQIITQMLALYSTTAQMTAAIAAAKISYIMMSSASFISANSTVYGGIAASIAQASPTNQDGYLAAGTITNIHFFVPTNTLNVSATVELFVGGISSSTIVITAGQTGEKTSGAISIEVGATDRLYYKCTTPVGAGALVINAITTTFLTN